MRLYHGGSSIIEHPDCRIGRDNLDFGKGFYTTLIREHAEEWARQVAFNRGHSVPVLNVYEFDKGAAINGARYRFFPAYDEEWMDFIVGSRSGERPWEGFDIIEGGIANDRVIDTIRLYMFGNMEKSTALKRLSEHRPNHQICILNQAVADKYLKFIESMAL
ncbi:MAG: DUF3990 domain-containing protein [Bacteroidales bacterium]|nr:DUF3990 domain-containing protein [Bacteroidales bacterium]